MNAEMTRLPGLWVAVGSEESFPSGCGTAVKVNGVQIAVFHYREGEWYAVQNLCPHQEQMVLSRGLLGDKGLEPKITCPLHKNSFSLKTGRHLGGNPGWTLKTYPVQVVDGTVHIALEPEV